MKDAQAAGCLVVIQGLEVGSSLFQVPTNWSDGVVSLWCQSNCIDCLVLGIEGLDDHIWNQFSL